MWNVLYDPIMDELLTAFRESLHDHYQIDRLVGRGGMADVYLATDRKHRRSVAVKILLPRGGVGVDAERFAREIEIAAGLQHPNILPVYDSGEAAGCLFFVMPYVEGGSLRGRLDHARTLPWSEAFEITRQVADALAFAHVRNVVHRDIKPENILFFAGHAVVADFGIARALTETKGDRITQAGFGLGTPEYMSPEQAFGEASVDERSDVYSLACVLYEMLSGTPPWSGDQPMALLMRKAIEAPPQLIADDASGVPKHVAAVLQRALEREQHDRFPDVPSMMAALSSPPVNDDATTASNQRGPTIMPAVAVLPFVNLGGEARDEYLCDGFSEELIHAMAQVRGIRVVSRTASFQFKGYTGDVRTIGNDLAATLLLEGGVRRQGNRLRINVRLIDVATGFERWSERFDRQFEDVFDVQDEIARAIVTSLEGTLQPHAGALVQAATSDMAAYELFLQARFYWNQRTTAALHRSVELLQRAVALDPVFALAHAALADCCVTLAMYGEDAPHTLMPQARVAAEQALRLKAGASQAHTAFACVRGMYDWNWIEAEQQFVLATRSPQASATAFQWFAVNLLVPLGRFVEAHAQLARARSVDPLSAAVTLSVGVTYHSQGNHLAAIREFQVVLAREPQFGMAHYFLARALAALGRYAEALTAIDRAETLLGSSVEPLGARGMILALSGQVHEATAVCTHLDQLATSRYVSPVIVAEILAALGKSDEAIEHLQRAVDVRATDLVWIGARPAFTRIADDARFADIIRTIRIAL